MTYYRYLSPVDHVKENTFEFTGSCGAVWPNLSLLYELND